MSLTLNNSTFTATIQERGAELASLRAADGREYIWNGDPAWWTGRAPILFPIVGMLKEGSYTHAGRRYSLPGHGFARISDFTVESQDDLSAALRLDSSPATRQSYPFDFSLAVEFRLKADGIAVLYRVTNTGPGPMLFSIGSHPGFMVPFAGGAIEDYIVEFDQQEKDQRYFIIPATGLIDPTWTEPVFQDRKRIRLSAAIFERGALVFKHPRSKIFRVRSGTTGHAVSVLTEGAPYLGIWARPGAPYVCIEPWHGIADGIGSTGVLSQKEGIISLVPGRSFETGYRVSIS